MPTPVPNVWQLQTKGDVEALSTALNHNDAGTRRGAAAALSALGAWQAVPALQAALTVERDWQVYAAIMAAIQYLDHDIHIVTLVKTRDVRGLSKMLNSTKQEDVLTACNALAEIGNRQAVEPLVMVFRNPTLAPKVRLAAAEALLKLESAPAVVTLLGALRRDDWQVRRNAAAVLGQLQASWAMEPLVETLKDSNPTVARTAAAALRRMGMLEAIQAVNAYEEALKKAAEPTPKPPTGLLPKPSTGSLLPLPAGPSSKISTGTLSASSLISHIKTGSFAALSSPSAPVPVATPPAPQPSLPAGKTKPLSPPPEIAATLPGTLPPASGLTAPVLPSASPESSVPQTPTVPAQPPPV